jgi:YVTN family beta-propeller protein
LLTVTASVPVGKNPYGVAFSPDGTRLYVANAEDDTVSVIDTHSGSPTYNSVNVTIPVGVAPQEVAVSPDGSRVYVTNGGDNTVSVVDAVTHTATNVIDLLAEPLGMAVRPDGLTAFCSSHTGQWVSVIDTNPDSPTYNTSLSIIEVGLEPAGVAVSPDGANLYVAMTVEHTVAVVDAASHTVSGAIPVGNWPYGLAVSPDGARLYVTNAEHDNTVSVIDTHPGSPTYNSVINAGDNSVSVIDTTVAPITVTDTIGVGTAPQGVAVSPDGSQVYVSNSSDNTVSVIGNGPPRWQGKLPQLVGELVGGVASGGGGWLVIGNHFYKVPPHALAGVAQAAAAHLHDPIEDRELGEQLRTTLSPTAAQSPPSSR